MNEKESNALGETLLRVESLVVDYGSGAAAQRAVDDVSFDVARGTTFAIVGESGCGKSTVARSIMRLVTPTSGRVLLDGIDLASLSESRLRPVRHRFQMVFQDPYGSLDPHLTASEIVGEALQQRGIRSRMERRRVASDFIDRVGLPSTALDRRPAEFSGGQRQRIGIARALASEPELLICDEATSALDVSVQAQIIGLLADIQRDSGITFIVISHNLGIVQSISDRVLVMRAGRVVETGTTAKVLTTPSEGYTRRLRRAALDPAAIEGVKPRHVVRNLTRRVAA